jgi:hypothetical protein
LILLLALRAHHLLLLLLLLRVCVCVCVCICRSVLWGRSVFSSIRKFLQFQLTVNFVALVVSFVGALVGGRMPLNVLQVGVWQTGRTYSHGHSNNKQCPADSRTWGMS